MTYEELGKMIIKLCDTLFDAAVEDMGNNDTSITLGAELDNEYKIKITIEKEAINNGE